MFRLFRLVLFIGIAFVAGILYERQAMGEKCVALGGQVTYGICER
jgi:ribose/xylose/arabinose/galactoside ABC-type transport system permease subunit